MKVVAAVVFAVVISVPLVRLKGHYLALATVGERLRAVNLLAKTEVEVEIVSPHFVDPEGVRLRG